VREGAPGAEGSTSVPVVTRSYLKNRLCVCVKSLPVGGSSVITHRSHHGMIRLNRHDLAQNALGRTRRSFSSSTQAQAQARARLYSLTRRVLAPSHWQANN
jgi:hypothetical protein